jgi:hypothetical protein
MKTTAILALVLIALTVPACPQVKNAACQLAQDQCSTLCSSGCSLTGTAAAPVCGSACNSVFCEYLKSKCAELAGDGGAQHADTAHVLEVVRSVFDKMKLAPPRVDGGVTPASPGPKSSGTTDDRPALIQPASTGEIPLTGESL